MLQLPLDVQLDDSAKFENFFAEGNQQLVSRLQSLKQTDNDFLYVWGSKSVGKSHLAQAICQDYASDDLTAAYFPLDNKMLEPEVLEGLEFANLVCLDTFDAIVGERRWEVALFNLFNALKASNKQLVIFSEQPYINADLALADLKSRLSSMETYKLNRLSDSERVSFLIQNAKHRGLDIPNEVAQYLLARTEREVSNLTSIVKLLDKQSLTYQRKITIPFVKSVLNY